MNPCVTVYPATSKERVAVSAKITALNAKILTQSVIIKPAVMAPGAMLNHAQATIHAAAPNHAVYAMMAMSAVMVPKPKPVRVAHGAL